MGGTKAGGLKVVDKNKAKDPDYYKKIGALGGKKSTGGGFKVMTPEQRAEAGRKGGMKSRRSGPSRARLLEIAEEEANVAAYTKPTFTLRGREADMTRQRNSAMV